MVLSDGDADWKPQPVSMHISACTQSHAAVAPHRHHQAVLQANKYLFPFITVDGQKHGSLFGQVHHTRGQLIPPCTCSSIQCRVVWYCDRWIQDLRHLATLVQLLKCVRKYTWWSGVSGDCAPCTVQCAMPCKTLCSIPRPSNHDNNFYDSTPLLC